MANARQQRALMRIAQKCVGSHIPSANMQQAGWRINIFQILECEMDLLKALAKAKERRTDVAHIHSRWAHPKQSHTVAQYK